MAGTNNFIPFDSANANMTSDANYPTNPATINGMTNGLADPTVFNKAVHQGTIMAAALAQYMANQGQNASDTNLANLITALTASIASTAQLATAQGNYKSTVSVTVTTTLTVAQLGSLVECSGTAPYTVIVPTPVGSSGDCFAFWNNTGGIVTLSTPTGQFTGAGFTTAATYAINAGAYIEIVSDGTNWFLFDSSIGTTPATNDNSTKLATTSFTVAAVASAIAQNPAMTAATLYAYKNMGVFF
jgi:hypothetical protein